MQQVEVGGGGPQQQGPTFFYRDVIAISRLVASRPAGVLLPAATKLKGKLQIKRPREVQSLPLPTLQETRLPTAWLRRYQRCVGSFPGWTPCKAKGWRNGGVGEVLGLQKRLLQFGGWPFSCSGLCNEGLAAGLAVESPQVSWCVSLSASRKAELHVKSWLCPKNSLKSSELNHPAIFCCTGLFKGSSATHPHLSRLFSFHILF